MCGYIDPVFLARATSAFVEDLQKTTKPSGERKKAWRITRNVRLVTLWSRQTVDVSTITGAPSEITMFKETDAGGALNAYEVINDEPQLVANKATASDVAIGLLGSVWSFNSTAIFGGAGAAQVNAIAAILGRASAKLSFGSATVMGPQVLKAALNGDIAFRKSGNGTDGELLGGAEGRTGPLFEPRPTLIEPVTTVKPTISINGESFAAFTPAVTTDFQIEWVMPALVANVEQIAM